MIVVATRLQLRGWRHLRRFFAINGEIKAQLRDDPGVVRYRRRADFLRLRFYTQSIWRESAAIDDFVRSGAHLQSMVVFDEIADRDASAFLRWEVSTQKFPTWHEARRSLASGDMR
ncbi:MAG: DUF3291 domain-containing protein [Acidimicrobiia bacterium]|nr:DUF3291 domain-containing protein [Acidimicrobiia bacterium]MYC45085.1 DUF3291 domain-containing protein [Acidimicrobiia bacterium]MYI18724.1 DUF3291 domain-containing protein [Acidimicrobiia bacterium]